MSDILHGSDAVPNYDRGAMRPLRAVYEGPQELWGYRAAASVLASFVPAQLHPFREDRSMERCERLLNECEVVTFDTEPKRWSLKTPVRKTALVQLARQGLLAEVIATNPSMDGTVVQLIFERCMQPSAQPFPPPTTLEDAGAMLEVSYWLEALPQFWSKLPSRDSLRQFIAVGQLLDPFRTLVGDHFAGRRAELDALGDYVGLHDASNLTESLKRTFEMVFSLIERPPLFVVGPGGAGKSTLIAKFVLEHAEATGQTDFPFAYLDFDRTALLAEEPITLLFEVMNQLSIQYPASGSACRELVKRWTTRIRLQEPDDQSDSAMLPTEFASPKGVDGISPRLTNRSLFLTEFAQFVQSILSRKVEQPLLLVLDTFEEVQFRSSASEDDVFDFLTELQQLLPSLRTVICGRTEISSTRYQVKTLHIGNFDTQAALAFLELHGISNPLLASSIVKQVGGSPLVLRLAADVARREEAGTRGIDGLGSRWLDIFRSESVEVVLYKRILSHVYDDRVKRLANPGLVLRFITPEVLLGILGPACNVPIEGMWDAQDLVRIMKRQLGTILVPLGDKQKLAHRPDMRSILLADLRGRAQKDIALATQLALIHRLAIEFYVAYQDDESRAEEIFHRLCLNQDRGPERSLLKERWRESAAPHLGSVVLELTPEAQSFVAARAGFDVKQETIDKASEEDWTMISARKIEEFIRIGKPKDAAAILRRRARRPDFPEALPRYRPLVVTVLMGYARFYENLRSQYQSGNERTRLMDRLVGEVRAFSTALQLTGVYATNAFLLKEEGDRVVALAIAQAKPDIQNLPLALEAIGTARTPFEQYHGLVLAEMFKELTPQQETDLRRVLLHPATIPFHSSDRSRQELRGLLLERWNGKRLPPQDGDQVQTVFEATNSDENLAQKLLVPQDDEPYIEPNSGIKDMPVNPALNLESFAIQSPESAPPPLHALYLRDGKYDGMNQSDVSTAFQAFKVQNQTDRLALFFHGGLVGKVAGQQSAANEYLCYKDLVFPLFFIWESGFSEVLSNHLPLIFAETIFGRVFKHANDLLSAKLSASNKANTESTLTESFPSQIDIVLMQAEVDAFQAAIENDPDIQRAVVEIANTTRTDAAVLTESLRLGEPVRLSSKTLMSPRVVLAVQKSYMNGRSQNLAEENFMLPAGALQAAWPVAKAAVPILLNCVRRFVEGRDHGMPCTLVEEIIRALYLANFGSSTWEEMKRETADAFGADGSIYGGTAVVEEICKLVQEKPQTVFSLVGHSTGGVYIGNFLGAVDGALTAQGDTSTQFDILLLAPANTVDFYAQTYTKRIRGIRIFQMNDATEQQDHLLSRDVGPEDSSILGRVYPRSLLYLVSGVCEYFEGQGGSGAHRFDGSDMPILGMDRYFEPSPQFSAVDYPSIGTFRQQFVLTASPKFARVISPTGPDAPPGFRSKSRKHGNFPGDAATIESLKLCFQDGL